MNEVSNQNAAFTATNVIRIDADPLGWKHLPKPVKDALRGLRLSRDDARQARTTLAEKRQKVWDDKQTADARLQHLKRRAYQSQFNKLSDDHPSVVAEHQKLEDIRAELAHLDPLIEARTVVSQVNGRLVANVEDYLECLGAVGGVKLYGGPPPIGQKRESTADAFERCGRRLRVLDADRRKVSAAPWHSVEAKRRALAEIDALARRGQPSVLPLIESPDDPIGWAERSCTDVVVAGRLMGGYGDPASLPLIFWLHREALIAKINAEIEAVLDDDFALTAQQRIEQLATIDGDRLAIQRDEEHWFVAATKSGVCLLRRPDADPRALLGLADDMPAPKNS
jgi:hypothetical protein